MTEPTPPLPPTTEAVLVDVGAGYPLAVSPGRVFVPPGEGARAEAVLAQRPGRLRRAGTDQPRSDGFAVFELVDDSDEDAATARTSTENATTTRLVRRAEQTLEEVQALRLQGVQAQPNHALLSHQVQGFPMKGFPMKGFPMKGFPMKGFPMKGFGASGVDGVIVGGLTLTRPLAEADEHPARTWPGTRRPEPASTAEPVDGPLPGAPAFDEASPITVLVLDTGLPDARHRPAALGSLDDDGAGDAADVPDRNLDDSLDPQAGHGAFIAGLIGRLAPGVRVIVRQVLDGAGVGEEEQVAELLQQYAGKVDLVNLSMGTYTPIHPRLLEAGVRAVQAGVGVPQSQNAAPRPAVVVASVGNDSSWLPAYPAALPDVVSVAALDVDGPADYTNMGPWVRACAPGTDLVSTFFSSFTSIDTVEGAPRRRDFHGWARWSGTSFAAPVVLAALARAMDSAGLSAPQAVQRVIDAPGLLRLPMLGTVVNVL